MADEVCAVCGGTNLLALRFNSSYWPEDVRRRLVCGGCWVTTNGQEALRRLRARDEKLALEQRIATLEAALANRRHYSPETIETYAAVLEAAFPDDSEQLVSALKDLWKNVHCDLSGELRGPHTELGQLREKVGRLEATLAERDRRLAELEAENARHLNMLRIASESDSENWIARKEMSVRIARLEEALGFYADQKNWCGHTYSHGGTWVETGVPCREDCGQRARQALDKEESDV